MTYVELHGRSAFSFLRGGSSPEELAAEAARLELGALALCDRDGFYGSVRLHSSGREAGLRAIVRSRCWWRAATATGRFAG